ncbi:CRISPR-associated protein Csd1 [Hyphomicrobium nitrativorans NL23]|uniref:CRISPR-associated protein Csd1 n=1 Tax=Hyphomicrobium nitrativorans NL23 TaxID=1029756 RepID=V5SDY9_9HYPH|nr:type I-C CRISPR-associated protein Cas8c/Csd1 [Hyphomicrobium nitrativorans]AHB48174.1 CRISPR-associated protein Csd1 [Hyphomicrobium nitrativorans NL23]
MTALASLARAYERMAARGETPAPGYSPQRIGFLVSLTSDGQPSGPPHDLREADGRRRTAALMAVPQPGKRTSGVMPNFLWDKTAYALGVTAGEAKRTAQEHRAFADKHREWLEGTTDEGLLALLGFLDFWTPEKFGELGWPEDMKDQNVAFALERERLDNIRIHDRPAAKALWARLSGDGEKTDALCLATGERGPLARLHPAIKGVWGAQTAGASIVSFNLNAFTSYGKEQGENAPLSEAAAIAYTEALNAFLRGTQNRIQIGDATTVFWADASDTNAARKAEGLFGAFSKVTDQGEAKKVAAILERIQRGLPVDDFDPVREGVRFHVLGLAPNAARLSVRFYVEDDFGEIARRYADHHERMRIEPEPKDGWPPMWRLLIETAALRKTENIQPNLAGDWMRAILTGSPYPLTLLSSIVMRLRADHDVNALRVAILKSVLIRNFKVKETPVSLDPEFKDAGYLLGRLFAVYEQVQVAALGTGVNATVKDKFFGAASAQPRKVFHILASGASNHLSKVAKQSKGRQVNLEKAISAIMELMKPGDDPFPASLPDKSQALFALGYYHQRNEFFRKAEKTTSGEDAQ